MEHQVEIVFGVLTAVLVTVAVLLDRARDARSERRHQELLRALQPLRPLEVQLGPDSSRPAVETGAFPVTPREPRLTEEQRDEIATRLLGDGPCCPRDLAETLGYRVEVVPELLPEIPSRILHDGVILAKDDRHAVLLAVAKVAIDRAGRRASATDVEAVAARLARPRAVRAPTG